MADFKPDTPCGKRPWRCQPRKVKFVAFDADETMWDIAPHVIATNICGPFTKVDDDNVDGYECGYQPSAKTTTEIKPKASPYYQAYPREVKYDFATGKYVPAKKDEDIFAEPSVEDIRDALLDTLTPKQKRVVQLVEEGRLNEADLSKQELNLVKTIRHAREMSIEPEPKPAYKPEPPKQKNTRKVRVTLLPTFRDTISELEKRDIKMAVISLNAPGTVSRIMEAFGFADKFTDIADTWRNKGEVIKDLMDKYKVSPCETLFLDNARHHVEDAQKECALGLVIGKGQDVDKPIGIMKYIED